LLLFRVILSERAFGSSGKLLEGEWWSNAFLSHFGSLSYLCVFSSGCLFNSFGSLSYFCVFSSGCLFNSKLPLFPVAPAPAFLVHHHSAFSLTATHTNLFPVAPAPAFLVHHHSAFSLTATHTCPTTSAGGGRAPGLTTVTPLCWRVHSFPTTRRAQRPSLTLGWLRRGIASCGLAAVAPPPLLPP